MLQKDIGMPAVVGIGLVVIAIIGFFFMRSQTITPPPPMSPPPPMPALTVGPDGRVVAAQPATQPGTMQPGTPVAGSPATPGASTATASPPAVGAGGQKALVPNMPPPAFTAPVPGR